MKYQYGIEKVVGDESTVQEWLGTFSKFKEAQEQVDRENDAVISLVDRGVYVRKATEAEAGLKKIEAAKHTRYYVIKRTVGEWEEANSWDE